VSAPNEAMELGWTVNFVPFSLREPVAPNKFREAKVKKLGILGKALALAPPWAPLYSARAPAFACFVSKPRPFSMIEEPALSIFFYCWSGAVQTMTAVALSRQGKSIDVFSNWFAELACEYLGKPTLETDRLRLWRRGDQELIAGKSDLYLQWAYGPWRSSLTAKGQITLLSSPPAQSCP
jgi:hypothetical protein